MKHVQLDHISISKRETMYFFFISDLRLDNGELCVFLNVALISSHQHSNVATFPPAGPPLVTHDPVIGAGFTSVTDDVDAVVD